MTLTRASPPGSHRAPRDFIVYSVSMSLHLYNTFTKKEEEFTTLQEGRVTMYTCGPTVYGRPHIGNYSSFLMADLLRRWFEAGHGYTVTHVKNITDVGHLRSDADHGDDKVEREAKKEQVHPLDIAKRYTKQYLEDEKKLRFIEPEYRPRATETIPEMIAMIEVLFDRGHAYETDDGVYFAVETFADYGKLSGNTLEQLDAGARIAVNEQKKHPADFALWKKCVGENAEHILRWESPWGEGFPGWHIECSCMARKFLGEQIDIHTGGEDLIFPHHECEIAQSECSGERPAVRYWLHRRFIDMGSEKMSKSLGNVLTLSDIENMGYDPMDLRYYLLSVHYRTNLKFTEKGLNDAHKARRKIMEWVEEVCHGEPCRTMTSFDSAQDDIYINAFHDAMNADLNTPAALAVVFDYMAHTRTHDVDSETQSFIHLLRHTFGCFDPTKEESIPPEVQDLISQREEARRQKNFTLSDELRVKVEELGYEVRDTEDGQAVKKK